MVIILAVAFLVLWQTGVIKLDSNDTTTVQSETVEVPNFVGRTYDDIVDDSYYSKNFKFEKSEVYDSSAEEGYVIDQSYNVGEYSCRHYSQADCQQG